MRVQKCWVQEALEGPNCRPVEVSWNPTGNWQPCPGQRGNPVSSIIHFLLGNICHLNLPRQPIKNMHQSSIAWEECRASLHLEELKERVLRALSCPTQASGFFLGAGGIPRTHENLRAPSSAFSFTSWAALTSAARLWAQTTWPSFSFSKASGFHCPGLMPPPALGWGRAPFAGGHLPSD